MSSSFIEWVRISSAKAKASVIVSHMICAMQIMSGTQPDTFINTLLSTNIRQSVDISWKLTVATTS